MMGATIVTMITAVTSIGDTSGTKTIDADGDNEHTW